jgi:cholestenol Delta-isomerase
MSFLSDLLGGRQHPGNAGPIPEPIVKAAKMASPLHPYYPTEIEIVGYIANTMTVPMLLASFAGGCTVIFGITYLIVKRVRPSISNADLATILWFVLCGCIHTFFEGYFAFNFRNMGQMQDLFGQLWKEYSLSDSRYLTQNAFVLCMETITAVRIFSPCSHVVYMILILIASSRSAGVPSLSSSPL